MSESPIQSVRWSGQAAIVDVTGDVDLHQSTALQQGLLEVLAKKPSEILINLAEVPYMDSSGVASLVKLLSRSRTQKVEVKIVTPSPKVRSIFEITRLDSVFTMFDSEEEALA